MNGMMATHTDILVTGKIRDVQVLQSALVPLLQLKSSGLVRRVLFSAWRDDLNDHATLIDQLQDAGVLVLDNGPALPLRSCGNYWEQVKSLATGLDAVDDGVYVFKTRTDLLYYGGAEMLARILTQHTERPCSTFGFKHRIWIPSFVAMQPFFMADQCYLGLADDLRRFVRFDAQIEANGTDVPLYPGSATHPAAASAEIRFWIQPFYDLFPPLREYQAVWPHAMNGYPHYPDLQRFNLSMPFYLDYLAIYWWVLLNVFRVSEGQFCIAQGFDQAGKVLVRANAHSNNSSAFIDDAVNLPGHYPVSYSTLEGLRLFIDGEKSAFHDQHFRPALARVLNHKQTPARIQAFRTYLHELQRLARP